MTTTRWSSGYASPSSLEERLQALAVDVGHVRAEALPAFGLHRRIQPRPFVAAPNDSRRAETFRAVASAVPVYEPEARLVEGHHLQMACRVACRRSPSARPGTFFEGLLLLRVGLLVAGPTRFELHFASPQKSSNALGMRVANAPVPEKLVRL